MPDVSCTALFMKISVCTNGQQPEHLFCYSFSLIKAFPSVVTLVLVLTGRITKFAGEAQQDQMNFVISSSYYLCKTLSHQHGLDFQFTHAFTNWLISHKYTLSFTEKRISLWSRMSLWLSSWINHTVILLLARHYRTIINTRLTWGDGSDSRKWIMFQWGHENLVGIPFTWKPLGTVEDVHILTV